MLDYFKQRALASSSQTLSNSVNSVIWAWHANQTNLSDHDPDILNVFLNIFRRNVSCTLPLFQDISTDLSIRADVILAMAAVGGLYCHIRGSFELSKAMYNDSRRRLLAAVRFSPIDCAPNAVADPARLYHQVSTKVLIGGSRSFWSLSKRWDMSIQHLDIGLLLKHVFCSSSSTRYMASVAETSAVMSLRKDSINMLSKFVPSESVNSPCPRLHTSDDRHSKLFLRESQT